MITFNLFQGPDGHPGDVGERGPAGTDGEKVSDGFTKNDKRQDIQTVAQLCHVFRETLDVRGDLVPLEPKESLDQR